MALHNLLTNGSFWMGAVRTGVWTAHKDTFLYTFHKMLIDGLESCGLFWCYYYSDGTHSLQRIHWWASNAKFLKICSDEEKIMTFVLFMTVEVSSKLYESYKQELALKKTILQELAHTVNADLSMVYLSSWLYQPYIEDSGKLLLESLLLETGHRPLWFNLCKRTMQTN